MDNPALIGVHRLQSGAPAGFDRIVGQFLRQGFQGFFPFFPVVAAVDGHTHVIAVRPVGHQAGQVLERCV